MHPHVDRYAACQNVLADVAGPAGLGNRLLQNTGPEDKLASYVDVGGFRSDGIAGQDYPFEDLVRIALDQLTVFKRTWLAFVGVTAQVARPLMVFGQKSPFDPRGEPGAASAAQAGLDHKLSDVGGRNLSENLLERLVTACLFILGQRPGVSGLTHVFDQN